MTTLLLASVVAVGVSLGLGAASAVPSTATTDAITTDQTTAALTAATSGTSSLSTTGSAAIDDVRRCIATNGNLDVYYLIDASGSLFSDVSGSTATDPDFVRADILGNSLKQLANLGSGVKVNYSAGFFGTDFKQATPWTPVSADTADAQAAALNSAIRAQQSLGYTNWAAGIAGAQAALAAQHAANGGCQMLVWLTDGALNLADNDTQNAAALNTLCGNTVDGSSEPADGLGVFNSLRASGVVVVGVLLSVNPDPADATQTQYMRPLVESSGDVNGTTVTCGQSPPPSTSVNGALVQASDPTQLATVFANLGVLINGGYPQQFDADGGFTIDPGISSFTVLTVDPAWSLTPPDGSGLPTLTASSTDPGVKITTTGGVTEIDVDASSAAYDGHWMLTTPAGGDRELYLYSGLKIVPSTANALIAGVSGALTGQIETTTGRTLDLNDYTYSLVVSKVPADGSAAQKIGTATVAADGSFSLAYTPGADDGGTLNLVYELNPLATVKSNLTLASVSASQQLQVAIPANFPTVTPSALALSSLVGTKGSATGTLTLTAPADGSAGSVCFPSGSTPTIVSDPADRASTWQWSSTAPLTNGCVSIPAGQTVTVDLSASNSVAANSSVTAKLPVVLTAADGSSLPETVAVSFDTTRPVNATAFNLAALILIVLGLLLALFVLWLMNFVTAGIAHGRQLLRGSFSVTIDQQGNIQGARGRPTPPVPDDPLDRRAVPVGTDLAAASLDDFAYQRQLDTVKKVTDADLGLLRSKPGLFNTRYEIVAPAGSRVFTPFAPSALRGARGRAEVESGMIAPMPDQLNKLWAIVVREPDLLQAPAAGPIPATLVVYKRNDPRNHDQFLERMLDVTRDTKLWGKVSRARVLLGEQTSGSTVAASGTAAAAATSGSPVPAAPVATSGVPSPAPARAAAPGAAAVPPPQTSPSAPGSAPRGGDAPIPPVPRASGIDPNAAPPPPRPRRQ
ncbi:hypothetical protein [Subtercola endophyticus]|uniref:hypothetical protein n=1 Tax=Subtercola endophyticus TaxID=2895559 RepID=UPI001E2EDF34|nr:hypothetical protein [Subtercola endophyticus]UFS60680.1 hypothetical protein LQ955_08060 [Subtercola endophyticus]